VVFPQERARTTRDNGPLPLIASLGQAADAYLAALRGAEHAATLRPRGAQAARGHARGALDPEVDMTLPPPGYSYEASGPRGGDDDPASEAIAQRERRRLVPRLLLRNPLRAVSPAVLRCHCDAFLSHDSRPVHRNCHTAGVGCRGKGEDDGPGTAAMVGSALRRSMTCSSPRR
jgi:hypothetical protein